MRLLEETQKYVVEREEDAKRAIEGLRQNANEKGYTIKKIGYERKDKKQKGEIIGTIFVISVTNTYGTLWEDFE